MFLEKLVFLEISKELRNLRKRFRQLQMGELDDQSRSTIGQQDVSIELIRVKEELEETVRQLEMENSQLHDALEDLGEDNPAVAAVAVARTFTTKHKFGFTHIIPQILANYVRYKYLEL